MATPARPDWNLGHQRPSGASGSPREREPGQARPLAGPTCHPSLASKSMPRGVREDEGLELPRGAQAQFLLPEVSTPGSYPPCHTQPFSETLRELVVTATSAKGICSGYCHRLQQVGLKKHWFWS